MRYTQGKYCVVNKEKYEGNYNNVVYRSSWELRFMTWCDTNPAVLKFSSEETVIPYICATDNRWHRYFVDFKIKVRTSTGDKVYLVEIKPNAQTHPPKATKKTKRYLNEMLVWGKNSSKWKYAKEYCSLRGMEFLILDEYALGIAKKPKGI